MEQRSRRLCLAIPIALVASTVWGSDLFSLPDSVQIHGFASQGYINSAGNNFFGDSKDGTFDFRELGINGSWRATPDLLFSAQAVSRNAGATDEGGIRMDYALVDYTLLSDRDTLLSVRAGRVVNPFGLYNDTRDVSFTRPSILLPQSIYFDRNRQLALSGDGVHLYVEQSMDIGHFIFQGGVSKPRTGDPDFQVGITQGLFTADLEGQTSWIGRLIYEYGGGDLRLALTAADLNVDFTPLGEAPGIASGEFSFSPVIFSAQYNAENWSLTSEYALRPVRLQSFGAQPSRSRFTGESYYLQGTYRFTPTFEGVLRYDVMISDRNDRNGSEFEALTGRPAYTRFAEDWTFGLRWNVSASFMLQVEYHNVDGTGWVSQLDNPDHLQERWDLFCAMASFRF